MNSSIILQEVYSSLQARKNKAYDDLNRLLARPEISPNPVGDAKHYIEEIAKIEHQQEITIFFNEQLSAGSNDKEKEGDSDNETQESNDTSTEEA